MTYVRLHQIQEHNILLLCRMQPLDFGTFPVLQCPKSAKQLLQSILPEKLAKNHWFKWKEVKEKTNFPESINHLPAK